MLIGVGSDGMHGRAAAGELTDGVILTVLACSHDWLGLCRLLRVRRRQTARACRVQPTHSLPTQDQLVTCCVGMMYLTQANTCWLQVTCQAVTVCGAGQIETMAPTATSDRMCETCPEGIIVCG